ncbi:MAG: DUF3826 domain-containing protein [Verrucomicrobiota bacterium]
MKTASLTLAGLLLAAGCLAAPTNSTPEAEAKYAAAIEGRAADILKVLTLADTNRAARVHDAIIAQYRTLRDWHDTNDAPRKLARGEETDRFKQSLRAVHEIFFARLALDLTPEQVEAVKDKMTYGKVQFTYTGYLNEYSGLTEEQKARVLSLLKEAREEAVDAGSADEKSAIFNRYKGKINNYLSAQGVISNRKKKTLSETTNTPAH